jgi:hydrogenase maturation protease
MKVLVIGIGNPCRGDDGLGLKVAEAVEAMSFENVTVDSDYQLNVEYAQDVSQYDVVVFADASVECEEPFEFKKIEPSLQITFTTHSMNAESVLALCRDLYGKSPQAFMLAVRGYVFEIRERLSDKATENMGKAVEKLFEFITDYCS